MYRQCLVAVIGLVAQVGLANSSASIVPAQSVHGSIHDNIHEQALPSTIKAKMVERLRRTDRRRNQEIRQNQASQRDRFLAWFFQGVSYLGISLSYPNFEKAYYSSKFSIQTIGKALFNVSIFFSFSNSNFLNASLSGNTGL